MPSWGLTCAAAGSLEGQRPKQEPPGLPCLHGGRKRCWGRCRTRVCIRQVTRHTTSGGWLGTRWLRKLSALPSPALILAADAPALLPYLNRTGRQMMLYLKLVSSIFFKNDAWQARSATCTLTVHSVALAEISADKCRQAQVLDSWISGCFVPSWVLGRSSEAGILVYAGNEFEQ